MKIVEAPRDTGGGDVRWGMRKRHKNHKNMECSENAKSFAITEGQKRKQGILAVPQRPLKNCREVQTLSSYMAAMRSKLSFGMSTRTEQMNGKRSQDVRDIRINLKIKYYRRQSGREFQDRSGQQG